VLGSSPVADALLALAPPLGFVVRTSVDGIASNDAWAVVAGLSSRFDYPAARAVIDRRLRYVAMVANRGRGADFADQLRSDGVPEAAIAALRVPAGLDIGALTPAEIALSILAEIVQLRRAG